MKTASSFRAMALGLAFALLGINAAHAGVTGNILIPPFTFSGNLANLQLKFTAGGSTFTGSPNTNTPITSQLFQLQTNGTFSPSLEGPVQIAALTGTITLQFEDGRAPITLDVGKGVQLDAKGNPVLDANGNAVRPLADMLKSDTSGALKNSIMSYITTAASQSATGGNSSADTATLASLMKVVAQADPAGASNYVAAAVKGLGSSANTTVIAAVVQGAVQGGATESTVTTAAIDAAKVNGVVVTNSQLTSDTTKVAVNNAITTTGKVDIDITISSGSK